MMKNIKTEVSYLPITRVEMYKYLDVEKVYTVRSLSIVRLRDFLHQEVEKRGER